MDPTKAQKIRKRTLVGSTLALALALLLWSVSGPEGARIVAGFAVCFAAVGAWEARRMGLPFENSRLASMLLCIVWCTAVWVVLLDPAIEGILPEVLGLGRYFLAFGLTLVGSLCLYCGFQFRERWEESPVAVSSFRRYQALLWLVVPLACLYPIRLFGGLPGLMALVVLSKVGDIVGYYAGSLLGKTHPFPTLSPGKTTAGCVGSLVAGIVFGIGCQVWGWFPPGENLALPGLWAGALAGATINVASQAGDLYESFWKRKTGVKDSGTWFGPSGGMLDLVDSLLFSAPLAALTWPCLFSWFA